ncbi:UDP-glucose 4-epimerase GalE [Polynucleobacter paneuropaeus]|nr:UDP-glucose 4-epimerase GalE [Polynucleobacter paneuropaeus]MBT8555587.1 UDP-glucose 4-epimerase GalE [Polynucleobacter paneuropaeus]MBT8560863.1 UDP-glucose 4-epimerase GalE [Polynucleobacter paneuropaeus]
MNVLVTGGAGYIGSHMVKLLLKSNYRVVIIDNLSTGHECALLGGTLIQGSIQDKQLLNKIFSEMAIDAVLHFAGSIVVGESVLDPEKYYQNNLVATLSLLQSMRLHNVKKLVFSSTAAIFGLPKYIPIDELHPTSPINPYGMTKLVTEKILSDYGRAYGFHSVCLRYFNAAGADPDGLLGERHNPETHLIPLALQVASGRLSSLKIYGNDYDTVDGTCIRDYVHVEDLCNAHLLALEHLFSGGDSRSYNLGNGRGYSILEVINAVKTITGKELSMQFDVRRDGDPPVLVADPKNIYKDWGWAANYPKLEEIVRHAWMWEMAQAKFESRI